MMKQADHYLKALGALTLAAGLTTVVYAQYDPVISLESVTSAPGETAQVRLSLAGADDATKALNFTIVISAADADLLGGGPITGTLASNLSTAGYTYEENTPVTGDGSVEYRGVVYPQNSGVSGFDATTSTHVVTLNIPIAADAGQSNDTDGIALVVQNVFDDDGITGLVGISDDAGNSIISGPETPGAGTARNIRKQDGVVMIEAGEAVDFTGQFPDGWEAQQILPSFAELLPTPGSADPTALGMTVAAGEGIKIANNEVNMFGFLQTANDQRITEGLAENQILAHKWTVSTNATDPFANPTIRLRAQTDGYSQISIFQEHSPANTGLQGDTVMPIAEDGAVVIDGLATIPGVALNGTGNDGMLVAMDVLTYGIGQAGNVMTLSQLEYNVLDPASLSGMTQVYSKNYAPGVDGTDGFTFRENFGVLPGGDPTGIEATSMTDQGLGIDLGDGVPNASGFAFGVWEKAISEWTVQAGKIYKVDFTVASTAATPIQSNIARLRVNVGQRYEDGLFDYVNTAVIESGGAGFETDMLPTQEGSSYTTYLNIPDVLADQIVFLSFDGFRTGGNVEGTDPVLPYDGGVILKDISVTAYDRPAFLQ